jgi:predicted N-formylglutamate amidohydrolase
MSDEYPTTHHARDSRRLIQESEPQSYEVLRWTSESPFLIVVDHASNRIPISLEKNLGLSEAVVQSHHGWDLGSAAVARRLAEKLDAPCILQNYSRLVIDCNRPVTVFDSIPAQMSEDGQSIPGNTDLTKEQRQSRVRDIFDPYHNKIATLLDERTSLPTALIAVHSFVPIYRGKKRPWHVGVLYHRDPRLALSLKKLLLKEVPDLVVGDNEPYAVSDEDDYAIPVHGERKGIPHVLIEIRQDLIADETGQFVWAERLAKLLPTALECVSSQEE